MSAAKQILNRMVNELPDDMMPEIISYIAFVQHLHGNSMFKDFEHASESSLDFWNNQIDDEVWNNV